MFTIRPYRPEDAMGCGECFYEGFFSCPIDANDRVFLRDYGQVLVEKCNFTYVAVTQEQQVVGFICGKYGRGFSKALAGRVRYPAALWGVGRNVFEVLSAGIQAVRRVSEAVRRLFPAGAGEEQPAIFRAVTWSSWRSPPRGISARDRVPRWSRGLWSAPGRTAQTPCV